MKNSDLNTVESRLATCNGVKLDLSSTAIISLMQNVTRAHAKGATTLVRAIASYPKLQLLDLSSNRIKYFMPLKSEK